MITNGYQGDHHFKRFVQIQRKAMQNYPATMKKIVRFEGPNKPL